MNGRSLAAGQLAVDVRVARRAVLAIFFVNGAGIASWVAQIPLIRERLRLSEGALGLTLLAGAVGAVTALTLAGGLIARFGSRRVTNVATLAFCVSIVPLILAPTVPLLVVALFLNGLSLSAMDVAMNAQAVAVEERAGRPLMSMFHAFFSTGGLVGAAAASVALSSGVSATGYTLGAVLVLIGLALVTLPALLPGSVDRATDEPVFVRPTGPLLGLGLLAFFALVSEGAMADWAGVYLRSALGTDPGFAARGYAVFSLAMAVGRFGGDALRSRYRAGPLVQVSGALAALGLGAALLVHQPLAALVGFGCVGLGLANVVPVLFSAAGRVAGVPPGSGIAAVATAGYCGFLVGPPLIGLVAQYFGLPVGLAVVVLFLIAGVFGAGAVLHIDRPEKASDVV